MSVIHIHPLFTSLSVYGKVFFSYGADATNSWKNIYYVEKKKRNEYVKEK